MEFVEEVVSAAGRSRAPTTKPCKICSGADSDGRAQRNLVLLV